MDKTTARGERIPLRERFWGKVITTETCWIWTGAKYRNGYGMLGMAGNKKVRAHRLAYELFIGPIPPGMFIDHICHTRACVNPSHLRTATNKQNMENQSRARCVTGHRNVYFARSGRYRVQAQHEGRSIHAGTFDELEDAVAAATRLRDELFTHHIEHEERP